MNALLEVAGRPLKISVVTPSYNQGAYIERTIRSVIRQDYPNLEYIILDGGSTDSTVEIIKRYEKSISYWRSEKDNGQAAAIVEGFGLATGDILCWLNSDDVFLPGCLHSVNDYFQAHSDARLLIGGSVVIDRNDEVVFGKAYLPRILVGQTDSYESMFLKRGCGFYQPATFWKRDLYFESGGINDKYDFCFDYDMYLRMARLVDFNATKELLSCFRLHEESKTSRLHAVRVKEMQEITSGYTVKPSIFPPRIIVLFLFLCSFMRNLPLRLKILMGLRKIVVWK